MFWNKKLYSSWEEVMGAAKVANQARIEERERKNREYMHWRAKMLRGLVKKILNFDPGKLKSDVLEVGEFTLEVVLEHYSSRTVLYDTRGRRYIRSIADLVE